ncbi:MAG: hypothetical protein NTY86_11420 [Deltaproteobacteria bacterium]|nr:hypothetical protein [Deltaproteobacteria bacterium]
MMRPCRPDDGTEILGIGDAVQQNHQVISGLLVAVGDDLINGGIRMLPAKPHDPLVDTAGRQFFQPVSAAAFHGNPMIRGEFQDLLHRFPSPSFRNEDFFQHRGMRKDDLHERVDAINHLHDIPP